MPTTRKRRPRHPVPDGLTPGLVNILLTGDNPIDPFLIFEVDLLEGGAYLPRLWRAHRPALLVEWRRRGAAGQPWGLRFDEETG